MLRTTNSLLFQASYRAISANMHRPISQTLMPSLSCRLNDVRLPHSPLTAPGPILSRTFSSFHTDPKTSPPKRERRTFNAMGIASAIGTAFAVGLAVNFFDKKSDNDVMSAEAQGICSQIDPETVKIVVFIPLVPSSHGEDPYIFVKLVRDAMGKAGAGTIGKYKECSFSIEGTSHFIQPNGKIIELREVRLEMVCPASISEKVIQAGLEVHPWETPGVEVFPLLKRELKEPKGI